MTYLQNQLKAELRDLKSNRKELAVNRADLVSSQAELADVKRLLKQAKTANVKEVLRELRDECIEDVACWRESIKDTERDVRDNEHEIAAIKKEMNHGSR